MKRHLIILLGLLLVSCSDKPNDKEIEKQILDSLSQAGLNIKNFEKSGGFEKDDKTYIAFVKYDRLFGGEAVGHMKDGFIFIKAEDRWKLVTKYHVPKQPQGEK